MFFYTFIYYCKDNFAVKRNKISSRKENSRKKLNLFKFYLQKKIKECIKVSVTQILHS